MSATRSRIMIGLSLFALLASGCGPKVERVERTAELWVELPQTARCEAAVGRGGLVWLATGVPVSGGGTELGLTSFDMETGEAVTRFTGQETLWDQNACGFVYPLLDGDSCVMIRDGVLPGAGQPSAQIPSDEHGTVVAVVSGSRQDPAVFSLPYRVWCASTSDRYVVLGRYLGETQKEESKSAYYIVDAVAGTMTATLELETMDPMGFTEFHGEECLVLLGLRQPDLLLVSADTGEEVARFNLDNTRTDPKTGEVATGIPVGVMFSPAGRYFVVRYVVPGESQGSTAKVSVDGTVEWVKGSGFVNVSDDGKWIFLTARTSLLGTLKWTVQAFREDGRLCAKTSYTTGDRWAAQEGMWANGLWWAVPGNSETGWAVEWLDVSGPTPKVNSVKIPQASGMPRLSYDSRFILAGKSSVYRVSAEEGK